MSDDAFPNAEQLFQQAFAAADPVPVLLQLVKEHPTGLAVRDLVAYYAEAVEENPCRGPFLASTLSILGNSSEAPTIGAEPLRSCIDDELARTYFANSGWSDAVKEYGPKNSYLLECLLSGLALRQGWTATNIQHAIIDGGLDALAGSDESELLVVGACLQLLLCGSEITTPAAGTYRKQPGQIALRLKAQKAAGIVRNSGGIQVLQLAIQHAESGLKPENNRDDVWTHLFPPKPFQCAPNPWQDLVQAPHQSPFLSTSIFL